MIVTTLKNWIKSLIDKHNDPTTYLRLTGSDYWYYIEAKRGLSMWKKLHKFVCIEHALDNLSKLLTLPEHKLY